ncbi:PGF-pre-PGF domain-containing protein [uncultured Methanomethylovorans sp.]|uniref:PGF-pre-PGF domain-containing protein n=1 Tax=uncultured Methanomethylovorans sp. TaxID=183759 RepID=UPI002AA795AA|nr:PGF-pre-PGF domain-containing protein [uncultured Methanomethylovorans sp.]
MMQIRLNSSIRFVMILLFVMATAGVGLAENTSVGLVSQFSGEISNVVIADNYAYLGQGQDFVVLDVSNVANPSEVGRVASLSEINDVVISGNYAYIANGDSGLAIFDISTPSSPIFVGSYDAEGFICDIAVSGNSVYAADGSGLVIVDVSTPSSPKLVGTYDTIGSANGVAISGNYAYIADDSKGIFDGSNGLAVIDVSTPSSPSLVGTYDSIYAYDVVISGNYAYVADSLGLVILDISTSSSPVLTGSYSTNGDANDVAISGNYVYVSDYAGLTILDISTPSSPYFIGNYGTEGNANGVAVSDDYVYLADPSNGLFILQQGSLGSSIVSGENTTSDGSMTSNMSGALELSPIGDYSVGENEVLTFTVSTMDSDAGVVYSASDMPAEATLDPSTGVFSWTPSTGSAGVYTVTFTAELDGLTDSEIATINVISSTAAQISPNSSTEVSNYSSEDVTNLVMTDVVTISIAMDSNVSYEFIGEGNDIISISFYSLKELGDVTSTIEVLKTRSSQVSSDPAGILYKYVSIQVGDPGIVDESAIKDARIKFRVNNSWLNKVGLNAADVRLQRYNGDVWEVLPTTLESSTTDDSIFESSTSAFSSFAITASKELAASKASDLDKEDTQGEKFNILIVAMLFLLIGAFVAGYLYLKKGHK